MLPLLCYSLAAFALSFFSRDIKDSAGTEDLLAKRQNLLDKTGCVA